MISVLIVAKQQIFYVGTADEVTHHAAPLSAFDVKIVEPQLVTKFAKSGDLAIFFSEHFHRFRQASFELGRIGCLRLYAIDGILEWRNAWENRPDEPACPWTMRPVLADKAACIGPSQVRVVNSWGNVGKVELVGLPRLDQLAANFNSPNNDKHSTGPNAPFRLLVTTAKWPSFTKQQHQQVVQSLRDLKRVCESTSELAGRPLQVIWRLTAQLENEVGVQNRLSDLSGIELSQLLQEVDAVITTPSTVMLESMISNLPTAVLDYTNSPRYVAAAWNINAESQIASVLQQLATPSARRLTLQRFLLEDSLQVSEPSTQRLERLVEQMLQIGNDCLTNGTAPTFPHQILSEPPRHATLPTQELWPARAANNNCDTNEVQQLQAIAAEALRRVDTQQEWIALLESELENAAAGFQKIASHPVLAPLVKVRGLALRLGGQISRFLNSADADEHEAQPSDQVGAK